MSWNHRVVRHVCKAYAASAEPEVNLELQEVFYDLPVVGGPGKYGHGAVCLHGETLDELRETAARLTKATEQPILDCKCDAHKEQV
jgi:hypothetical protein